MPPRAKHSSGSTPELLALPSLDSPPSPSLDSPPSPSLDSPPSPSPASGGADEQDDSSDSDDADAVPLTARPRRTSPPHTHLAPHGRALFPPFYNRPPTPLPPSPSLTSLLRPSFSTPSRPSTPDSSDVDVPTGTPARAPTNLASITKSAQHAPTVPRAAPKVPSYEYYGFALHLASSAALLLYLVWAYLPSPLLHHLGIHYYPNRWWALAVPCWLVASVAYVYVALASYNTRRLTLSLASAENLVDECAQVAVVDGRSGGIVGVQRADARALHRFGPGDEVDWAACWSVGTDAVMDVPVGAVCEVLYGGEGG